MTHCRSATTKPSPTLWALTFLYVDGAVQCKSKLLDEQDLTGRARIELPDLRIRIITTNTQSQFCVHT